MAEKPTYGELAQRVRKLEKEKLESAPIKESETHLQALIHAIPDLVWLKDPNGVYLSCNARFETFFGAKEKDIVGKTDYDFVNKELADFFRKHDKVAMKAGKPSINEQEVTFAADGHQEILETIKTPMFNSDGELAGVLGIGRDITARKRAEEARRESETFIKAVMDKLPIGIAVNSVDPDVSFEYINDKFFQCYRTTRDALSDPDGFWTSVYEDPVFREEIKKRILDDCSSGDPDRMVWEDVPITRKGEETSFITARNIPIPDKNIMISIVRDSTERYRAEQEQKAREALLRRIIHQSPFAIWISDAEGTLQIANPALKKFLNLTDEQLVGKYNVLKDPVVERQGLMPLIRSVYEQGKTVHFNCDWDGKDINTMDLEGLQPVSIEATMFPIHDADGRLTHVVLNWIDVTDWKKMQNALLENEARFRSLFENMYDGVAIYRPVNDGSDFVFVDMNASGQRLSKVKKEDVVGKCVTDVFPAVREMGLFEKLKEVFRTGNTEKLPVALYEDGRISQWVDNTIFRLPSKEIVAVYRDESERHIAEDEIKKLNEELENRVMERTRQLKEINEELEDFAYSVSHDLRAPLRSISGFSEIIDRRHKASLNEEGRHYFDNIINASRQMGDLIDDLLKFSRLGRKAVNPEAVSLDDVFASVLGTLGDIREKTGARIHLPQRMPVIYGDFTLAANIVINLLDNAMKYRSPDKPPIINVEYETTDRDVLVSIADNGIGIEPEYHEKIFNIFQRLHSQADYPGTGIGLAAVRKALQMMGGEIRVASELGKGSVFKIKFVKG